MYWISLAYKTKLVLLNEYVLSIIVNLQQNQTLNKNSNKLDDVKWHFNYR